MAEHVERFNPSKELPIITYGLPYEDAIANHLTSTVKRSRPYLLVSGSLSRDTDVVDRLTKRLRTAGVEVAAVQEGIRSHTLYADLLPILAEIRSTKADSIIVVGGGSLVDGAKVLSYALANGVDSHEAFETLAERSGSGGGHDVKSSEIPYMCATTTLSAGEYSSFGGATNERTHQKQLFYDPSPDAGHRVIVIDPRLTLTAPPSVWLSTGMRAVDHCVETVCSRGPKPEATAAALQGIRQLIPALLRCKKDANDLDARLQAQLGAGRSMKGVVVYGVELGASHGIGHQLGPQGVPHAETTCVLLPAVLKYNARVNKDQQKLVLDTLWDEPIVAEVLVKQGKLERDTADLGDTLDVIIRALDLPRALSHYGIGRDKLESIATLSLKDWMCKTNPVPLEKVEQVVQILEQCL
ncbi:Fe-containing alcohol dehydrogenase [Sporothrix brasiliensis 5110]|uniref:Fe-containing alcohol dehydrogenase n=1 Tax=Sporothrix brasiliensis 5110 TaxID=1398154 RepID=A0A0C2F0K7_9PEZI|nr:Fe-containing alcohol dehydrogenase [Sporothrix brasiliensis 5110]KIH92329.1 Fe-containing alcohol dehydrogenase [Sporothrix brasiliensis 5110]